MSRIYFGTYEQVLYPYVKHNLKAEDRVQNETAFVEHLLLAPDEEGNTVCDITSSVASRYRTGARAIPDNVVALFRKANARNIVIEYLDDLVIPYIERGRKQQLLSELVDLVIRDKTIDADFKKAILDEATSESLAAFLADLLIYSVAVDPTKLDLSTSEDDDLITEDTSLKRPVKISNVGDADGLFFGRAELLRDLEVGFKEGHQLQFISGGDGWGKSRVALEYAQRHADEYQIICWINAWSEDCVISNIINFFDLAKVSYDETLPEGMADLFCRFFNSNTDWLIIFDNADLKLSAQKEILKKYIPSGKGHILITGNFGEQNGIKGKYHQLGRMSEKLEDGMLYELCYGQPLPMTLISSFIRESSWVDEKNYLHMLEDRGITENKNATSYIDEAAFEIKMSALYNRERYFKDKVAMAVRQFLTISAILSQLDLDLVFLSKTFPILPDPLGEICKDNELQEKLVESLKGFGFYEIRENVLHGNIWLSTLSHEYFSMEDQEKMCEFVLDKMEKNPMDSLIAKPYVDRARYYRQLY